MFKLAGGPLKVLKAVHIFSVCCWLGGGMVLFIFTCAKYAGWIDGSLVHGVDFASHIADQWVVVIMGAFTCLGTALVYGALTGWGFFRHRWIIIKWLALVGCIFFGMWLGGREEAMLELSARLGAESLASPEYQAVLKQYAAGVITQLVVISGVIVLSIFRPWKGRAK